MGIFDFFTRKKEDKPEAVNYRFEIADGVLTSYGRFDLPEITTDENGLSRMELPYLPAFEEAMLPESEEEEQASGPQGVPEAASAAPTRDTKGN